MIHGILIGVCVVNIIALIIGRDYLYTIIWVCCLCVTVSDLHRMEKIKSLEEEIRNLTLLH